MDRTIIRIVLLASSLWGVHPLEITNLTVPNFVRNGTEDSVLLDCEYNYEEEDKEKLVVKWFHDDDPFPVYQWIPELNAVEATDKFGNRVSKDFELDTGDMFTKRRALHLLRPTIEMSGKYSCQVASLSNTVEREDNMVIYAIPSSISINISSVDDTLYVTCMVKGVFPLPEIEIFHTEPGEMDPSLIEDAYPRHEEDDDAFDAFLTTNMSKTELRRSGDIHFFACAVELKGTEYRKETEIPYYPISRGLRPGLRRKIHSEDYWLHHPGNDPEHLDLDMNYNQINTVEAQPLPNTGNRDDDDNDDDDDDDDNNGDLDVRPSVITIMIFASALLVLCW